MSHRLFCCAMAFSVFGCDYSGTADYDIQTAECNDLTVECSNIDLNILPDLVNDAGVEPDGGSGGAGGEAGNGGAGGSGGSGGAGGFASVVPDCAGQPEGIPCGDGSWSCSGSVCVPTAPSCKDNFGCPAPVCKIAWCNVPTCKYANAPKGTLCADGTCAAGVCEPQP